MTEYIKKVKRALRDQHHFSPLPGSTEAEPLLNVPDGMYDVNIDGQTDHVRIEKGNINCCNFD